MYVGRAARTDFSRIIFPTLERNLAVQLCALWRILSTSDAKISLFLLPKFFRSLRYFPTPPSLVMFRSRFALALASGFVFEEKVIVDLAWFIHCPETSSYFSRIETRALQLDELDLPKNIVLSANKR